MDITLQHGFRFTLDSHGSVILIHIQIRAATEEMQIFFSRGKKAHCTLRFFLPLSQPGNKPQKKRKKEKKAANILYWQKNKESEFEEQNLLILQIIIFRDSFNKAWATASFQGTTSKNTTLW